MTAPRKLAVFLNVFVMTGILCVWSATADAAFKTYPVPRPKPQVPLTVKKPYPFPRLKPQRDQGAQTHVPTLKPKPVRRRQGRFTTSRATEEPERHDSIKAEQVWSADQIAKARQACRKLLDGVAIEYQETDPVGGPGGCGIAAPITVSAVGATQSVTIDPPATMNCKMAAAVVRWIDTRVQISALAELGEKVVKIRNAASYACRRRNNKPEGKLSEHALGNALDVSSFTLESDETVTVLNDWASHEEGDIIGEIKAIVAQTETPRSRFLEQVHDGGCQVFSTILGPNANKYHADHFHFDLGRGGRYLVCR